MFFFTSIILTFLEVLLVYINHLLDMMMNPKNRGLALTFHGISSVELTMPYLTNNGKLVTRLLPGLILPFGEDRMDMQPGNWVTVGTPAAGGGFFILLGFVLPRLSMSSCTHKGCSQREQSPYRCTHPRSESFGISRKHGTHLQYLLSDQMVGISKYLTI